MSATLCNFQSNLQILVLLNVRFALLHPYPNTSMYTKLFTHFLTVLLAFIIQMLVNVLPSPQHLLTIAHLAYC